jgi:hypothetical protein
MLENARTRQPSTIEPLLSKSIHQLSLCKGFLVCIYCRSHNSIGTRIHWVANMDRSFDLDVSRKLQSTDLTRYYCRGTRAQTESASKTSRPHGYACYIKFAAPQDVCCSRTPGCLLQPGLLDILSWAALNRPINVLRHLAAVSMSTVDADRCRKAIFCSNLRCVKLLLVAYIQNLSH